MKIVFPGPDGQPITVADTRRPSRPGKAVTLTVPVDRRPVSFMLSQFRT